MAKARLLYMQGLYSVHLKQRYLHDVTYKKGGWYKHWTDKPYSSGIHKASLFAFIISFVVFQGFSYLFPYLNPWNPNTAQAGSSTVTWTTQTDFQSATTNSNIDTTSLVDSVKQSMNAGAIPTGTGDQLQYTSTYNQKYSKVSVALDASGNTYMAIIDRGKSYITLRNNLSGSWADVKIDVTTAGGLSDAKPTILFDSNQKIYIIFLSLDGDIWMTDNTTGGFYLTEIYDDVDTLTAVTATIDSNNKLYISSMDEGVTTPYIFYLTNLTGSWVRTNLTTESRLVGNVSLAISPTTNTFKYCYNSYNQNSNTRKLVVNGTLVLSTAISYGCSMATTSSTNTHTGFFDDTNSAIKYSLNGGTPTVAVSGVNGDGNTETSIAVTSDGKVHLAYNIGNSIYLTILDSGTWSSPVLIGSHDTSVKTGDLVISSYQASRYYVVTPPYYHFVGYSSLSSSYGYVYFWNDTPTPYISPATLGSPAASSVGLRADAGTDAKAKAATLTWNGTTASTGQKILFKVRAGDTQAELDTNQCYGPTTLDSGCADWTTAGKFFSQINGQANSATTIPSAIAAKRYIEVLVRLESSGANTPVLNDVTLTYDTLEAPTNSNLILTKTDNTNLKNSSGTTITGGVAGGYTNESTLRVTANSLTCTGCSTSATNLRPEVEVKAVGSAFTGTGTYTATAGNSYVDIPSLVDGTSYHLQVRAIDDQGRVSGWTAYGANDEASADVSIDQVAPTGTVSINAGAQFATSTTVNLTLSATDTGGSTLGQMRFSNDGTNWGTATNDDGSIDDTALDWTDYTTSFTGWDLPTGDGTKTVYAQFRDDAGNVSGTWIQTSDADFNAGTKSQVTVGSNSVYLNTAPAGFIYPGRVGTALEGKWVYSINSVAASWKTADTTCREPFCSTGLDTYNLTKYSLNNPQLNPEVSFTDYPAQNACKTLGGRLPYMNEALELYAGYSSYGNNLGISWLWTATEWSDTTAQRIGMVSGGFLDESKSTARAARCIVDASTTGYLSSSIKDFGVTDSVYGLVSINSDIPANTSITIEARAGNTAIPDGTWTSYYTLNPGQNAPSELNNHRYLQYKATLTGDGSVTPTLYDISFESATGDTITLDTQAPSAFDVSSPANNLWQADSTPAFEWGASTDANLDHYELWIDGAKDKEVASNVLSVTPDTPLTEGSHEWYMKAVDAANNATTSTSTRTIGYDVTNPSLTLDTGFTFTASDSNADDVTLTWDTYADDSGDGAPADTYTIERLKYSDYEIGEHTLTSTWSTGGDGNGSGYYLIGDKSAGTYSHVDYIGEDPEDIEQAVKYIYRIKVKDEAGNESVWLIENTGLTSDGQDPSDPSNVVALPCQTNGDNCSNVDNKGYEIKLTWSASYDSGTGVTGYKIYRRATTDSFTSTDFTVVGYLDVATPGAPVITQWYDNDTANNTTYSDTLNDVETSVKPTVSARLNDYVYYYYRVTALDASGNETDVITMTGVPPINTYNNWANARTIDATNPPLPTSLTVTPVGVDSLGNEPMTQRIDISWGVSVDKNNQTRTPNCVASTTGCSIKEYVLQQAQGDVNGPTEAYMTIYTGSNNSYIKEGLVEDTYYYYKVKAIDKALNESNYTSTVDEQTKNSRVPTTPTSVLVTSKKGNPNTDNEVGYKITVSFNGSKITGTDNKVTGYKVYRSTTNNLSRSEWQALTPVMTYDNLNIAADVQDGNRTFIDTVTDDATTYYYKVEAIGWNESNQEVVNSPSLSAISPEDLHLGWDTTPDATAPTSPLEVKVKDIHGDGTSMVRNIITWQRLDTTLADNLRSGSSDFAEYRVYRYTALTVANPELIVSFDDLSDNYYVDGIPLAESNNDYYYYVVAVDNANNSFKYPEPNDGTVINAIANISDHLDAVSINPAIAKPTVSAVTTSNIGVSAATINWTTNQSCDSVVEYRAVGTDNVLTSGKNRQTPTTNHSVTLKSLAKNTDYEYRIISENSLGNTDLNQSTVWPAGQTFKTENFAISHSKASEVILGASAVTVKWTTSLNADTLVEYQIVTKRGVSVNEDSDGASKPGLYTKSHEVSFPVIPASKYVYKIRSITQDGYVAEYPTSGWLDFTTPTDDNNQFTVSPSASKIAEENITATSARVVWESAVPTTSWLDYGTSTKSYKMSAGDDQLNTHHVVDLKNLTPGQKYYYIVRGTDTNENDYISSEYTFTAILKPEVTLATVQDVTPYSATIVFSTNVDTEASIIYGTTEGLGQQSGISTFKRNHQIGLTDLTDGSSYYYQIEIKDKLENTYKTSIATFATPIDTEGAKVNNLKIDILPMGESDEFASVIVSWNTNKPATTKVEYDEGVISGKYGKSTIEDTSLNTSHTVIIKDLNPSTTYHFRIAGHDKRDNKTNSQDYTFVTPEKNKSVWQLIVRSLEETFSWVSNVGGFFRGLGSKLGG